MTRSDPHPCGRATTKRNLTLGWIGLAIVLAGFAPAVLLSTASSAPSAPHVITPSVVHVHGHMMPTIAGSALAKQGATSTWCLGLYPTPNISYTPGCYGHDEPTISYMSSAASSGADASWWEVLPKNGATLEQGDLYATFWYGGTVKDSASLNGVAFLEWQFYPLAPAATGAGSGTTDCGAGGNFNGNYPSTDLWFSCVIVWEVVGSNEQAAYAGPVDYWTGGADSTAILEMHSGDQIYANYTGSPTGTGWTMTLHDLNTGQFGQTSLSGSLCVSTGCPLNPDTGVATWCQLSWGASCPGQVAWAYEIGHSLNPAAGASCNPGDGTCDSYNPTAWTSVGQNEISLPVLGVPSAREYPLRFGFSSSQGGLTEVNGSAGCPGGVNCVYPWYIYQSQDYSFTYQASASSNNTYDYGNANQYSTTSNIHKDWTPPYANVTFVINKGTAVITANPGRINQTGGAYTAGNLSSEFATGTYQIGATAAGCVGYSQSWYFKAGVAYTVNINLLCGGPVTNVDFFTSPSSCGSISFNSATYTNGQTGVFSPGTYPVSATPCAGYTSGTLTGTGSVSITGGTATTVAGQGSVWANFTAVNPKFTVSFSVSPAGRGDGILFNGTKWYNGQSGSFLAGPYAVAAAPVAGWKFAGWTSSGGVGPVVGGTATVTGAGSITATYTALGTVRFVVIPSTTCAASISFNATSYVSGQQGTFASAGTTYPLVAGTCPGYGFTDWTATSGLTLASSTLASTTGTLNDNATLTANYAAVPLYTVTFSLTATCTMLFNGTSEISGAQATVYAGTYPVQAASCTYYAFSSWSGTSTITIASPTSGSTTVTVSGNGTLTGSFTQVAFPVRLQVYPTSCTGVQVKIGTGTYTNGQTAYLASGSYTVVAGTCAGEAPTPTFQVGGGTHLSISAGSLTVSGGGGTLTVTYLGLLRASLSGPTTTTVGSSVEFTASMTGGLSPYSLTWTMGDGSASLSSTVPLGAASGTMNHTYSGAGTFAVRLTVTDSQGQSASAETNITVSSSSTSGGLLAMLENPLVLLLLVVVVAAIVAAVALSRRKKGKLPTEAEYYQYPTSGGSYAGAAPPPGYPSYQPPPPPPT
ncbi:MAG: PKD domain-containing protein [Euryarchaeota archaeon]|nr:PKD domain-containing protein [Euryarchaeota archaeon]MDE2046242.1 PKD domain-containing protein [Thermoplasmata archaeon]